MQNIWELEHKCISFHVSPHPTSSLRRRRIESSLNYVGYQAQTDSRQSTQTPCLLSQIPHMQVTSEPFSKSRRQQASPADIRPVEAKQQAGLPRPAAHASPRPTLSTPSILLPPPEADLDPFRRLLPLLVISPELLALLVPLLQSASAACTCFRSSRRVRARGRGLAGRAGRAASSSPSNSQRVRGAVLAHAVHEAHRRAAEEAVGVRDGGAPAAETSGC